VEFRSMAMNWGTVVQATCANGHSAEVASATSKFCPVCGAGLLGRCPNGHETSSTYCGICGEPAVTRAAPDDVTRPVDSQRSASTEPELLTLPEWQPSTSQHPLATSSDQVTRPVVVVPPVTPPADGAPPSGAHPPVYRSRRGRLHPLAWVCIGLAAVLLAVALTLVLVTMHSNKTPAALKHSSKNHRQVTHTTATPVVTTSTTTTTLPLASEQASALSDLLVQSSNDRFDIDLAVRAIGNCGNLEDAETVLNDAASSRQSLLNQVQSLSLTSIPSGAQLAQLLTTAWTNSMASDQSYSEWAGDEINNGCTRNDTSDLNYQNAQVTDQNSTNAKTSFVQLWNPIATMYGLPTQSPTSI
jgi:predicted RNA-binding Zn-ribbon protein involved in translation (DUF1610 family)